MAPQLNGRSGTFLAMPLVAGLSRTPVKGMALDHPTQVELSPAGIPGDRLFYLVDASDRLFSGSSFGPLVRIRPRYDPLADRLKLTFPDGAMVEGEATDLGTPLTTDFYGRPVTARVVKGPWEEAVSAYVGSPIRLLRCDREGDATDVHHLTLVSLDSVRELADRGGYAGDLDPRRFRINIHLEGCSPYEEDGWEGRRVHIGDAEIHVVGQVPRCLVTTQDPNTGEKDWDTLTQIAKSRPRIQGDGGLPFGMYAEVLAPGPVRVGDSVGTVS